MEKYFNSSIVIKYKSFYDIILNKNKSKINIIYHILKYKNKYYKINVYDIFSRLSKKSIVNKYYNLQISLYDDNVTYIDQYVTLSSYSSKLYIYDEYYLIINEKMIKINTESINYDYNNFLNRSLGDYLYITINLDQTDISELIWEDIDKIYKNLIDDDFDWTKVIKQLIIYEGCPLIGINNCNKSYKILGLYLCKTIDDKPLLWFISGYTILKFIKNNDRNEMRDIIKYKMINNRIITTEDYIILDSKSNNILIPKDSILIYYNNKMLLYGDNVKDIIDIKFKAYQNYDKPKKIVYIYKNKYYTINNKFNDILYKIVDTYDLLSIYNYKGMKLMKLSLELINFILYNNLIIDSYEITEIIKNPNKLNSERYCIISFPKSLLDKLDENIYIYKILNNLLDKYIRILEYIKDRPQIVYLPIIKNNIDINKLNDSLLCESFNLCIDSTSNYTIKI